jgi:hypothetical protein
MDERLIQLLCNTVIFVTFGVYSIYQGKLAQQGGKTIYYFSDKVTLWFHRNTSDEEIEIL